MENIDKIVCFDLFLLTNLMEWGPGYKICFQLLFSYSSDVITLILLYSFSKDPL